jgi:uncharacterized protein with HEPN domain
MAPRKIAPVIGDMLEAIEGIQRVTGGKSLAEFREDWTVRLAVQRAIEIISEASKAIPQNLQSSRPEIPWERVRGSGNVLRHGYFRVADDVIWDLVQADLVDQI